MKNGFKLPKGLNEYEDEHQLIDDFCSNVKNMKRSKALFNTIITEIVINIMLILFNIAFVIFVSTQKFLYDDKSYKIYMLIAVMVINGFINALFRFLYRFMFKIVTKNEKGPTDINFSNIIAVSLISKNSIYENYKLSTILRSFKIHIEPTIDKTYVNIKFLDNKSIKSLHWTYLSLLILQFCSSTIMIIPFFFI